MPLTSSEKVHSDRLYRAFDMMAAKEYSSAENELNAGLAEAESQEDRVLTALFYSTLAVLHKMKKEFAKAWKYYEKAEKLLPEDPALKLISARPLIDVFGQFDTATRRCQKVLEISRSDPPFLHQANTTMGMAYLKKGERAKAQQALVDAMEDDFGGLVSAANIDLKLLEAMLRKKASLPECRTYLEKARSFAQQRNETSHVELFQRLIDAFPSE